MLTTLLTLEEQLNSDLKEHIFAIIDTLNEADASAFDVFS